MSTIKFISKLENYQLKDDRNSVIQSPFIEPSLTNINFENKTFLIEFVMSIINTNDQKVRVSEGSGRISFNSQNIETIVNFNGNETEVEQALMSGWAYDISQVLSWGKPSFQNVFDYVDITANGLVFKEGPGKQLAIDLILNTVIIEGEPLGTHFELEIA
jgi:predicted heme/steroid binding protein